MSELNTLQEEYLNSAPTLTPTDAPTTPRGYLDALAIVKDAHTQLVALEAEMIESFGKKSREVERVRETFRNRLESFVLAPIEQSRDKEVVPANELKAVERRQMNDVLSAPELKDILAFGDGIGSLELEIEQHTTTAKEQLARLTPPKAEKAGKQNTKAGARAKTASLKDVEEADATAWIPPKNAQQIEESAKANQAAAAAKKTKLGNLMEQLKGKAEAIKGFFVRVIKSNLWEKFISTVKNWASIANRFADIIQEARAQAVAIIEPLLNAPTTETETPVTE